MAYFREMKTGWRAEVERAGVRKSAVFPSKREAQAWARIVEGELLAGKRDSAGTFKEAAERYLRDVSSAKRGQRWEALRIPKLVAHFDCKLSELDSPRIAGWRDARLREVSPATVLRESKLLSNILRVARDEWAMISEDPMKGVRMPSNIPARHQRWHWREIRRICRFLDYRTGRPPQTKQQEVALAFLISLRTAMRAGEVLQVGPSSLSGRVVTLDQTKTERRAQVPLTRQGFRLCSQVTGWTVNAASLDALFRKARDKCLVGDLRFHDARATALTMLARKVDILTLARISRHKDLKMLSQVYYRESAAEIAQRLA